jgi:hypothetical protein
MKVGPSEPLCRGRLQTAGSCCRSTMVVVNVPVKRRGIFLITSCRDQKDERKRTCGKASKRTRTTSKPGFTLDSGNSMVGTCLLAMRCPVQSRRESDPGFRTELENLGGSVKGKGSSGQTARLKVPMGRPGADCSVVVRKRGNARGAKGAGHLHWDRKGQRATGGTRWS